MVVKLLIYMLVLFGALGAITLAIALVYILYEYLHNSLITGLTILGIIVAIIVYISNPLNL